jgi:hypothetical protein
MSDLGREAQRLVDAARFEDEPTDEDRARVRRALAARIVVGAAAGAVAGAAVKSVAPAGVAASAGLGGAAATVAGSTVATGIVAKTVIGISVILCVSASALLVRHELKTPRAAPTLTLKMNSSPAPVHSSAIVARDPAPVAIPRDGQTIPREPPPRDDAPIAPVPRALAKAIAPRASAPPSSAPSPVGESEVPSVATGATAATDALLAETALLRDANAALRAGDPARSLRILDEHTRRFGSGGGVLLEEKQAARVFALAAVGPSVAQTCQFEREAFLASHGHSPHASRVRGAVCFGSNSK